MAAPGILGKVFFYFGFESFEFSKLFRLHFMRPFFVLSKFNTFRNLTNVRMFVSIES